MKQTKMLVNGKFETYALFYHGETLFADKDGFYEPEYTGVDMLMLYTLTPGVTSSFKDIQICPDICPGTDPSMLANSATRSIQVMLGVIINILIMAFWTDVI